MFSNLSMEGMTVISRSRLNVERRWVDNPSVTSALTRSWSGRSLPAEKLVFLSILRSCSVRFCATLPPCWKKEYTIIDSTPPGRYSYRPFKLCSSCITRSVGYRYFSMVWRGMYTCPSPNSWKCSRSAGGTDTNISASVRCAEWSEAGLLRAVHACGSWVRLLLRLFLRRVPDILSLC